MFYDKMYVNFLVFIYLTSVSCRTCIKLCVVKDFRFQSMTAIFFYYLEFDLKKSKNIKCIVLILAPNPLLTSVCVYGPKNQINDAYKSSTYKWYLNQLCKYLFWWNLGHT